MVGCTDFIISWLEVMLFDGNKSCKINTRVGLSCCKSSVLGLVSKMTYNVLIGTLNPTHSLSAVLGHCLTERRRVYPRSCTTVVHQRVKMVGLWLFWQQ